MKDAKQSNTAKHTPGPWEVDRPISGGAFIKGGKMSLAVMCWYAGDSTPANAERIVSCVNAFDGVDTDAIPSLPGGTVSGLLELSQSGLKKHRQLKQSNDELVAALRECRSALVSATDKLARYGEPLVNISFLHDQTDKASAVLAKVRA